MPVTIPDAIPNGLMDIDHIHKPLLETVEILASSESTHSKLAIDILAEWNKRSAQLLSLKSSLQEKEHSLTEKQLHFSDNPNLYITVGDTFATDRLISSVSSVSLDTEGGYVLLPLQDIENINPYIGEITISKTSIGRPGDVSTVRNINRTDTEISVDIADSPSDDPQALIDQNPDSWYTWEEVSVPLVQPTVFLGKLKSTIFSLSGVLTDVVKVAKNYGFIWKGVIPGQGVVEKPLFRLFKEHESPDSCLLELEFKFTSPVPLSTVRLTPLADLNCPLPIVKNITILTDKGNVSPPGLPREITPNFGKFSDQQKTSIAKNVLSGSGIFQLKSNALATGVRITLEAKPIELKLGTAHLFKIRQIDTSEKTYVLGLRAFTRNTHSSNRVSFEGADNISNTDSKRRYNFLGDLFKSVPSALVYSRRSKVQVQKTNNTINTNFTVFTKQVVDTQSSDGTNNYRKVSGTNEDNALNTELSTRLNAATQNTQNSINNAANTANLLASVGGKKVIAILGLAGPAGILVGAALNGDLFRKNKSYKSEDLVGVDVWQAFRAAIILRDISFDSRVYQETAEIITEELEFKEAVRAVSLSSQIEIPKDWGVGVWFESYIKTISGEWQSIKSEGDPSSFSAKTYIEFPESVTKIQCRFILRRPSNKLSESPIFTGYIVKGIV